jgi:hypothetical protein
MTAPMQLSALPDFSPLASEDYQEVLLDSADFYTGDKNTPQFLFNYPIQDIIGFRVVEASIPFTWYVIMSGVNNQFQYKRSGGSYSTVSIPSGNYDYTTFPTVLQGLLNTADGTSTFTVTCSKATNFTLNIVNSTYDFTLDFSNTALGNAWQIMGFVALSTNASSSHTLNSPNTCNFTGAGNLFVGSNFGSCCYGAIKTSTFGDANTDVIATVPLNVNPGSIIAWQNPTTSFFTVPEAKLDRLSVWFTQGPSKTHLNFNGTDFWIKLAFVKRKKNAYSFTVDQNQNKMKRSRFNVK